jgi:hypothetical protein
MTVWHEWHLGSAEIKRRYLERLRKRQLTMAQRYPGGTHWNGQPVRMFVSPWFTDEQGNHARYVCQQGDYTG